MNNETEITKSQILSSSVKELMNLDISKLSGRQQRLRMLLLFYAKHHLDSDAISWEELDEIIFCELCEAIGDKAYQEWMHNFEARNN